MFWSRTTLLLLLAIGCGRLKFDPSALDNDAGTGVLEDAGNDAQVTSSCPPPGSGAIAWYTFDEPADLAADQLGLHSGTVQNGVPIQAGSLPGCGSALQFPSDSFLELPDSDDWDSMQSLSLWVRVDVAPPDTAAIISRDISPSWLRQICISSVVTSMGALHLRARHPWLLVNGLVSSLIWAHHKPNSR